jgi:hypothetical protein
MLTKLEVFIKWRVSPGTPGNIFYGFGWDTWSPPGGASRLSLERAGVCPASA